MEIVNRSCPFCFQLKTNSDLKIVPKKNPTNLTQQEIKHNWNSISNTEVFFSYYRCNCGGLYNKEYFSIKSLNELYSKMRENIRTKDRHLDIKTKMHYVSILSPHGPFNHALELGPDNGSLAENLIKNKVVKNIDFVEPNKTNYESLKKITKNEVFENIYDIKNNIKYDLIIGVHVLDHIPDTKNYVLKIESLLKSDGKIFGVVHNEKSLLAKIFANSWPAYHIQHPHLFNTQSINVFFENLHFKQIFTKKTRNYFNVSYLLEHLIKAIFKKEISIPSLFAISLKLGNFAFMFKKEKLYEKKNN